jgi:formate hydrogenlyase subunit 3/multisubunit Na+/H+ antiporter MnhD subunit
MAHQTFLTGRSSRSNGLIDNVSSFSNDLATLATLQTKLAAADLREGLQKAAPAVGVLAAVGLLSVAGVTALVIGLAFWLAESFQLRTGSALALVGLGSLVVAALGAWLGARALASSFATFRRSSEELERNLAWIKTTLTQSGR